MVNLVEPLLRIAPLPRIRVNELDCDMLSPRVRSLSQVARQPTPNMFYCGSYHHEVGSKNKSEENWSNIMKIYQLGTLLSNLASKANLSAINIEWLLFYLSVSRTNVFIDLRYDKLKRNWSEWSACAALGLQA